MFCSICLDDIKQNSEHITLECSHQYHHKCFSLLIKSNTNHCCSICREPFQVLINENSIYLLNPFCKLSPRCSNCLTKFYEDSIYFLKFFWLIMLSSPLIIFPAYSLFCLLIIPFDSNNQIFNTKNMSFEIGLIFLIIYIAFVSFYYFLELIRYMGILLSWYFRQTMYVNISNTEVSFRTNQEFSQDIYVV